MSLYKSVYYYYYHQNWCYTR